MKLNQLPMHKAYPAIKILLIILCCTSCYTTQPYVTQEEDLMYEVINLHKFRDHTLFYKTQAFVPYMEKRCFNFQCINKHNVKKSTFLENKGYINFDTIFNKTEQKHIEAKMRASKSIEINASKLNNPKSISKESINLGSPTSLRGYTMIMLPVIQSDKKGNYYAFFYKSWSINGSGEGNLYIYVKDNDNWNYLSKVPIFVE